ncbi:MAG: glycosyltransferase family 39 protein [Lewinellaceae bacterium]|nr:glycosyltransferase family 39 protein [Lewinellaceae bacterium]
MAAKQKKNPVSTRKTIPGASKPAVKTKAVPAFEATHIFQSGFWKTNWLPALLLMVLAYALYAASRAFGYVLDDQMVIWQNGFVQNGFAGIRDIFSYDSFMGYFKEPKFLLEGGRYRPLSLATFAMEVGFFGKDHPGTSHFINILLYGLNGVLLYRVLSGLFPLQAGGKWFFGLPFLASVFFMAHPLHVEVVANIKGRDEILALMGSLAALYASLKYFDTGKSGWLALSGFMLFLGMLAKENAITFLAIIPLTVWFFGKVPAGRSMRAFFPLLIAFLVFFIMRYKAMGYIINQGASMTDLMNNPFLGMTTGERFATIFLTLGWYVKLLFVPHPLTHDYYPYHVPKVSWSDWRAIGSFVLYAGMGVWAVLNLNKRKVPAYAILYFLLTLSIVSNIFVSVGTFMNDRFLYMPSVAYCIVVAWFLTRQLPNWLKEQSDKPYILGVGIAALMLGVYGYWSYQRVPDWKDALSLNTSAVRVSPNSARANLFYATAVYENLYQKPRTRPFRRPLWTAWRFTCGKQRRFTPTILQRGTCGQPLHPVGLISTIRWTACSTSLTAPLKKYPITPICASLWMITSSTCLPTGATRTRLFPFVTGKGMSIIFKNFTIPNRPLSSWKTGFGHRRKTSVC